MTNKVVELKTHDWKDDGVDLHKGEYWYHCAKCGRRDWIALYGTLDQLEPAVCESHTPRSK